MSVKPEPPISHSPAQAALPGPILELAPLGARVRIMGRLAVAMMFFDKLRLTTTMLGVVFAVILSNQAIGTLFGIIHKNAMVVRNADADLWLMPRGSESLAPGKLIPIAALAEARVTRGVALAEPLLFIGGSIKLPNGGTEPVSIFGARYPHYLGGPWNLVVGDVTALSQPGNMIFEESEREILGGLNLGSVREVNGRTIRVGAFTYGLLPLGTSYAFADYELARELGRVARDQTTYGLVKLAPGADAEQVKRDIQARVPEVMVATRSEVDSMVTRTLLTKAPVGVIFGASTVFGLIIGFVVVSLSMFSAVVDNIREFGTLKAIGANNFDLAVLMVAQSIVYGLVGSLLGLAVLSRIVRAISSAKLIVVTPTWLSLATFGLMVGMCVFASLVALGRIRKVEPAMVFR
ncbi:MAG: hypothetical protein RJA70_1019 [Pseudomonadota bacterium]